MTSSSADAAARVLLAVGLVPPGSVASYGDIARVVGVGPRQVGAVLRRGGGDVPWWRIVAHDGVCHLLQQARPHWDAEGIEVRPDGRGCSMRRHRADLTELATEYLLAASERGWPVDEPR